MLIFNREQAQAINKAISEGLKNHQMDQSDFVTKLEFKNGLKELENTLIKWMIGTAVGILVIVFTITFTMMQLNTDSINQRMNAMDQRMNTIEKGINENKVLIQKLLANTSK